MASSTWTGAKTLDDLTRGQQAEVRRLTGISVLAQTPGWAETQENLLQSALARQRAEVEKARQEAALRQQALARVSLTQPAVPTLFGATVDGPLAPQNIGDTVGGVVGGALDSLPSSSPTPPGYHAESNAAVARMLAKDPNTPAWMVDDYERLGGLTPGTAQGLPAGVSTTKGPEREGYIQQPITNAQGVTIGYKYVALGDASEAQQQEAAKGLPQTNSGPGAKEGRDRNYPLPTPQDQTDDVTESVYGNPDSQYDYGTVVVEQQRGAYGEPTGYEIAPDGSKIPVYAVERQKYIGIDENAQKYGFVKVKMPNPPGPDATPQERAEYTRLVNSGKAVIAPRYRINDDQFTIQNMTRDEQKSMQKAFKAAGLYEPDDLIEYGVMGVKDQKLLQDVMGFANQQGLTVKQALVVIKKNHDRLEAQKNAAGGGGGGSGQITRQVQISYDETSMAEGRGILANVLAGALGRPPTDRELAQYMARLNRAEGKSPTRTVTNYVRSGSSQTTTSRTNPSDVDPEAMAREFAMEINGGEEFFDMQANSYLDSLMQSLIGAQNV